MRNLFINSLKIRLLVLCVTISIVPLFIAGYIAYDIAIRSLKEDAFATLEATGQAKENNIATSLKGQIDTMVALAKNHAMAEMEKPYVTKELLQEELKIAKSLFPEFYQLFLMDKKGKVIASSHKDFIGLDRSKDPYFVIAVKGAPHITDVYLAKTTDEIGYVISAPVYAHNTRNVVGVLAARKKLYPVNTILKSAVGLGETGEAYIVNKDDFMITGSRFLGDNVILRQKIKNKALQKARKGKDVLGIFRDYRGVPVLGYYSKNEHFKAILGLDWVFVVEIDLDEAFAPVYQLRNAISIISVVTILAVILASISVANTIVAPVRKLSKASSEIAKGNLDYEINIDTKNEIGELADSFNKMTKDLKRTTTSIDELNREISERKRAEEAVRRSEKEWHKTFDSISDLIFIQDMDFTILKANKAFADLFKCKPEDLIGKKCYELLHKTGEPWRDCPFKLTKEDGKPRIQEVDDPEIGIPLLVSASPIFDEDGKVVAGVHVATNISERKKTEKALIESKKRLEKHASDLKKTNDAIKLLYKEIEQKNKKLQDLDQIKSDFVSTVSHELRTPLSIVKEGISIVLDGITGRINKDQRKFLNMGRENMDRLTRIINNLLDISKIEAGRMTIKKKSVDINKLLEDFSFSAEPKIKKKGLKLQFSIPKNQIMVFADEDAIISLVTNLVGNAMKFTKKGHIAVSLKEKKNMVECSIVDTGIGIAKNNLPKLFGKFEQFSRKPGSGEKGTGLGLSISKAIIRIHDGRIWVESVLNKGTKFTFTLPKYSDEIMLRDHVGVEIKAAMEDDYRMSVISMSIDNVNQLDQELGHEKLKSVLNNMEGVLQKGLRRTKDSVFGSDRELIVILTECSKENIMLVQKRLTQNLMDYITAENLSDKIKLSFSSATYPDDAGSAKALLDKARGNLERSQS